MKISPWIWMVIATALLNACGNADDQRSMSPDAIAAKNVADIHAALDQANKATKAIEAADTDRQKALQLAKDRRKAVEISIARLTKQSEMLKQDAENKTRWANLMQERAIEARQTLLQAALEQSRAEELVAEKKQAVEKARIQAAIHQDILKRAVQEKVEAEQLAAIVIEAKKLAALSLSESDQILEAPVQMLASHASPAAPRKARTPAALKTAPKHHKSVASKKADTTMAKKEPRHTTPATGNAPESKPASEIQLASTEAKATADPVRGHALAQKCQLCHSFEPGRKAKFGPALFGIVGQQAGKVQNYKYGNALATASFTWNEPELTEWICNSGKTIKKLTGDRNARTKMPNQNACGQKARDIVAYLGTLKAQASNTVRTGNL